MNIKIQQQEKVIKNNYKKLYINEKKVRENIEIILKEKNREIDKLKKNLEEKNKEIEILKKPKGYQCSISGNNYEKKIYNITKKCNINGKPFNTQNENELGGSSNKHDIICNFKNIKDIGIEIKKYNTPDWMQCCIKYDNNTGKWITSKSKNPEECTKIFMNLINDLNLYDGDIPPFMKKQITHEEWLQIKKETIKWDDKYIDIPSNTIRNLYKSKGCSYIQISNNYGLYHLEHDICNFNVPLFEIDQQLRIRIKIHSRKNKKGFCNLSVTISCKPKNIKKLIPSKYSLDNKDKLPINIIYNPNQ